MNQSNVRRIVIGLLLAALIFGVWRVAVFIYPDKFFSKQDAIDKVEFQDLLLTEPFEIISNETSRKDGDAFKSFTLLISEIDRNAIIKDIRQASNFTNQYDTVTPASRIVSDYPRTKKFDNFETEKFVNRKLHKPLGRGFKPYYIHLKVSKDSNEIFNEETGN